VHASLDLDAMLAVSRAGGRHALFVDRFKQEFLSELVSAEVADVT